MTETSMSLHLGDGGFAAAASKIGHSTKRAAQRTQRGATGGKEPNGFEKGEPNPNLQEVRKILGVTALLALATAVSVPAQEEPAAPTLKPPVELIVSQPPPQTVPRVLEKATPENTRITVSLGRQRIYLYVGDEVAIDAPISSGKKRGQTPTGSFTVTDKAASHSSNMHGDLVDADGNVVRHGVSTRIDPAPSGMKFVVVPVQHYLRLNDEGLALHAGRLPGYPAADTAVRLPTDIAPLIYQRVKKGTVVMIEE
jgi:lipoprotein-anchoring transpeptidase ErfK/SrfK